MSPTVRSLGPGVGAEISGLDLRVPILERDRGAARSALLEPNVIVICECP